MITGKLERYFSAFNKWDQSFVSLYLVMHWRNRKRNGKLITTGANVDFEQSSNASEESSRGWVELIAENPKKQRTICEIHIFQEKVSRNRKQPNNSNNSNNKSKNEEGETRLEVNKHFRQTG